MRVHYIFMKFCNCALKVKVNETAKRWNTPHPKKGILCRYDIRIQTVACVCACSWENQLQVLSNTKRSCNRSCSLNQHDYQLKSEHMQLKSHYSPFSKHKPLLLFHIVLLHISSQVKCYSSQFLEAPRAAEKHMRSSRARWPSPGSGAAPQAEHLTVTTETDGHTHTHEQGAFRTEHAPHGAWYMVKPLYLEQDKV